MTDTITLGSIIGIITVVGAFVGLMMHARKIRRENEADADAREKRMTDAIEKHNDSVEKRLNTVEVTIRDFMPRAEIESKIEHEKNNRTQADDFLRERGEKHDGQMTQALIEIGRLHERGTATDGTLAEIKLLLKDIPREMGARLDKLADQVAQGARA